MLCGVTATLGSNPSATATAARPHWGRAVLLCLRGVLCCCVAVWPHGCSGSRRPRPPARLGILTSLCAAPRSPPVPSGPSGALHTCGAGSLMVGLPRRLEAQLWLSTSNFARNSFTAQSNIECASLELQCFWGVSKNDRDKLRAKSAWPWCRRCPWESQPGPVGQVACLSETVVAFACWHLWGD